MEKPSYDNPDFFMHVMKQYSLVDSFAATSSHTETLEDVVEDSDLSAKIIIWSYNRPKLLSQAISSVINQDYENLEIFVIDDGSEIFDPEDMQAYFNDSRLVIVKAEKISVEKRSKRSRLGENTNFILETFDENDIVFYLCDDDLMAEHWISRSINVFNKSDSHVIQGQTYMFGEGIEIPYIAGFQYQTANALTMVAGSFCHRATCFIDEGLIWKDNEHLHSQDASFIRDIFSLHSDIIIATCPSLYRRVHDNNLSNLLPENNFAPRDGKITKEMLEQAKYE